MLWEHLQEASPEAQDRRMQRKTSKWLQFAVPICTQFFSLQEDTSPGQSPWGNLLAMGPRKVGKPRRPALQGRTLGSHVVEMGRKTLLSWGDRTKAKV